MLLCCLLAVLLMSTSIFAMPSTATTLDGPRILSLRGLVPSSPIFVAQARVLHSDNGSVVLILI